ncbi:MAG: DUF1552 domain-containing protein [Gemmataceae bacterium]
MWSGEAVDGAYCIRLPGPGRSHLSSTSMDQSAAKYLGPTWLTSLALSFANGGKRDTLTQFDGLDIPAIGTSRRVFERLVPSADKAQLEEARKRLALERSVLDTASDEVNALQRRLGASDQYRLEEYLTSIRKLERRLLDTDAILRGAHDYHHQGCQGSADNPDGKLISARDEMVCACLGRLMTKLAAWPAKDGSVLDSTVLLLGGA